jgi:hypothetical protein
MAGAMTEPQKHLALDTDWRSAILAVWGFFIFAFFGVGITWMTLQARFDVTLVSWWTPLIAACLIYLGVHSETWLRVGALVLAIGPVSRIILWLARASHETQFINEEFVRWIDSALFFAGCVYVIYWFKTKIRHV